MEETEKTKPWQHQVQLEAAEVVLGEARRTAAAREEELVRQFQGRRVGGISSAQKRDGSCYPCITPGAGAAA